MRLETVYLNGRIEFLDAQYGPAREAQYAALSHLYNRVIGPVTALILYRPELLDLGVYSSSCSHSSVGGLVRDLMVKAQVAETLSIPGGGKGIRPQQPLLAGLGEAAERLLALLHFQAVFDRLVYASYEELADQSRRALGPDEIPLFAPEQYARPGFEYVPFLPDTRLRWIEGRELLTHEPVLVPAQLVLLYYKQHPQEPEIGYSTSGGLAFHSERRRAILHGLYEVIERDAINVRWYSKIPPPQVDVDLAHLLVHDFGARYARLSTPYIEGTRVYLNTLDVPIPTFTALAIDRSRQERALMSGGAAWSTPEWALAQALFEVGQACTGLKFGESIRSKGIAVDTPTTEMNDFFDAMVYFGFAQNLARLEWYMQETASVPWEAVPRLTYQTESLEYDALTTCLEATGLRPIVFDFDGACWPGVSVIKVFIPQLTQASVPSRPFLGHPRFYEISQRLGLADHRLEFRELNTDPPPFP